MSFVALVLMSMSPVVAICSASAGQNAQLRTFYSQPSFVISTNQVKLAVTELVGHMAPGTFFRDRAQVQSCYISPWQDEKTTRVNYIRSVVKIPDGLETARDLEFMVAAAVRLEFLRSGKL
jgi:hypothetical protein